MLFRSFKHLVRASTTRPHRDFSDDPLLGHKEAMVLQYFVDKCNWELAQRLKDSKQELAGMKTQERVRTAIQWRLEMQIPFMGESFL